MSTGVGAQGVPPHWVLSAMVRIRPAAPHGVRETYDESAEAIARASEQCPIFDGEHGPMRTAAMLLSIALKESQFNPKKMSGCGKKFGLFQLEVPMVAHGESNAGEETLTANALLLPLDAALIACKKIKSSLNVTGDFGWHERLGWYTPKEFVQKPQVDRLLVTHILEASEFPW